MNRHIFPIVLKPDTFEYISDKRTSVGSARCKLKMQKNFLVEQQTMSGLVTMNDVPYR